MNFRSAISDFRLAGRRRLRTALRSAVLFLVASLLVTNTLFAAETLEQRRERVAAMSPEEKAKLQQRWERYQRLSPAEKEKLKRLDEALTADKDEAALRRVMQRYAQWLGKQGSSVTAQLIQSDPRRRATLVKRYASKVSKEDLAVATDWLRQIIIKHERPIIETFPPDQRPWLWASSPEHGQQSIKFWVMMLGRNTEFWKNPPFDDLAVAQLCSELSPQARRWIDNESPVDQALTVFTWIRGDMPGVPRRPGARPADDEQLLKLFEEMPEDQLDPLLRLSGDELHGALQYRTRPRGFGPGFPGEPGGPKGPGGPRFDSPKPGEGKPPRFSGRPGTDPRPEPPRGDGPEPKPPPRPE